MKACRIAVVLIMVLSLVAGVAVMAVASGKVNINSASKEELMQLEGIGSAYAEKIIEYRETNGPFEKAEDITNVKGVGAATFEKNRERITVAEESDADVVAR